MQSLLSVIKESVQSGVHMGNGFGKQGGSYAEINSESRGISVGRR
jgi:hypothetical protein